ncbi:DUF4333 domain-containing protein [Actinophytocola sediminis]
MSRRWLLAAIGLLAAASCTVDVPGSPIAVPGQEQDGGGFGARVFDEQALEGPDGVLSILVDDYAISDVESVDCPADQEVTVGSTFDCVAVIGGEERTVTITVLDDDGAYQVGAPQ